MGKRINYLNEVDKFLGIIMEGTRQLIELTPKIKDKAFKTLVATASKEYASLNYRFSLLLLAITPDIAKRDIIDKKFNSIMKQFEKEKND